MKRNVMRVSPHFDNFIFDWDYETYLCIGAYGSGKSYAIAQKIILKLLQERRRCVVFRNVYRTIEESTYDLIREVLAAAGILADANVINPRSCVVMRKSPLAFDFPNGSKIIFRGLDDVEKIKSMNNVSIAWVEECTEITKAAYLELLGRVRQPEGISMHFILSCNPVSRMNWVYRMFFADMNMDGTMRVICDENRFYQKRVLVKEGVYYHHSVGDDNPFVSKKYLRRLDRLKWSDTALWAVARLGQFGTTGLRVLPRFEIMQHEQVMEAVRQIPGEMHRVGMDFGFEKSYNAVTRSAVDVKNKWLYIYKEYYKNQMTDDETAVALVEWDAGIKNDMISADCAEPKAIRFYRKQGFQMRPCKKVARDADGSSRITNTKKFKRFLRIICSTECVNCIQELKDLTYKKDRNGDINYGVFETDPHTFSSLWYAWDDYDVTDYKKYSSNSWKGGA